MKKFILALSLFFISQLYAKPLVVVSILPQKSFVEKIAKGMADVELMVKPGNSPHSYEPKASQMISISKADIYLSIGVEFENVWLERFRSQNASLKIADISSGIEKTKPHSHGGADPHRHEQGDPHTWTSPKNVEIMANNICRSLIGIDPQNEKEYLANLDEFVNEIRETDAKIREILKDAKGSTFMVFHPSWSYFAKEYGLMQIAVEAEGKEPKPKEMIKIIGKAKASGVRVIFTQPEFSDKSAKIIAKESGVAVKKISPLNPEWSQNLIEMAGSIAQK